MSDLAQKFYNAKQNSIYMFALYGFIIYSILMTSQLYNFHGFETKKKKKHCKTQFSIHFLMWLSGFLDDSDK